MSLWSSIFPPPPVEIREAVVRHQYAAMRDNMPVLHAVAVLNLLISDYALWRDGFDPRTFAWTGVLVLVSLARLTQWKRRAGRPIELATAPRQLRTAEMLLLGVMIATSTFAVWATATKLFSSTVLVPISLMFGSLCLAHAMAAIPVASATAVLVGIVPPGLAMLWFGDEFSRLIAVSALSVTALKVSFMRQHYFALLELLLLQKRVTDMASFDSLTGLLSRRALFDEVNARLSKREPFALALVDLDGFKAVNDTRGHAMGDALLRAVSKRFMDCGSAVGRLGGDEFVVMLDGIAEPAECGPRMEKILEAARTPVVVGEFSLQVSASVGYSLFPSDGADAGTLMRVADEAMYAAKRGGKARALGRQA